MAPSSANLVLLFVPFKLRSTFRWSAKKEGLKLTRNYYDIINGHLEQYRVVQKYITNLFLINNRKINLRVYLLIMIKNNSIYFYLSDIGKCIYTNKEYNDNDLDFESNITSYNLDMTVYKTNPRNFDELKEYVNVNSTIDEGRGGKLLFNNIELLMREISQCLSYSIYQSKNIKDTISFQIFGADIIFDTQLNPYLLELNKGPDMSPRDKVDLEMKIIVQKDMFDIVGITDYNQSQNNSFKLLYQNHLL